MTIFLQTTEKEPEVEIATMIVRIRMMKLPKNPVRLKQEERILLSESSKDWSQQMNKLKHTLPAEILDFDYHFLQLTSSSMKTFYTKNMYQL